MKKIFSLLLVCTMIFSLAALTANADTTATYNFKAAAVSITGGKNSELEYDTSATSYGDCLIYDSNDENEKTYTAFALEVSANYKANAGNFAISYDNAVVQPAILYTYRNATELEGYLISDFNSEYYELSECMNFPTAGLTTPTSYIADSNMIHASWSITGGYVEANQPIVYIGFVINEGKTIEDFDENTFKVLSDVSAIPTDVLSAEAQNLYGSLYLNNGTGATGIGLKNGDVDAVFTYPNSQPSTPSTPVVDPSTTTPGDASFTDEIRFPTEIKEGAATSTAYTKKVVVFAKNNTGADLAANSYGIEIGDFYYPGLSPVPANSYWRIVLVSTDANKLAQPSYNYTAVMEGATSATGTVTPSAN